MPIYCFALITTHEKNKEMSTPCREAVQGRVDISYFFVQCLRQNKGKLHGRYFIKKISALADWSLDCPYIIQGEFFSEHNIIVFKLDEAIACNKPV